MTSTARQPKPGRLRRTAVALIASTAMGALLLTACGGGASTGGSGSAPAVQPPSQAEIDKAMTTPTTLTFWNWVPGVEDQVALFEKKYPAIDVKLENVGNGAPHYAKIRTSVQAGEGAADVAQVEYQYINSFVVTNTLLDLAPYGARDLKPDYSDWVWNQVSRGDAVYAVPGDAGPMGNLYREDILTKAGVTEPPKTWADYAKAAEKVRATGKYISDFPSNNPGQLIGLLWQSGAKPFSYDGGKKVGIDLTDPKTTAVLKYWQDLIDRDLVSVDADFNDQWYQGLSTGKYAGWITAAWGPVYLQGTAKNTSGKWRAAPLPQWTEGANVSGNWGGSTAAVLKTTKNPIVAYEFAKFINHDQTSALVAANKLFLFPTLKSVLTDPAFVDGKSEFYGDQKVNALFADVTNTVDTTFDWLPYTDYAYSSYNETLGKAIGDKGDLVAAAAAWQEQLVTYGKDQGFEVN
ncbi:sugar ABC transporter substrate-binding protein [Microlunatus spumicola]|uniref:Sugar ABC transporter substrate-binding protein n=1 Tax=Microlunatus spumicola TaxID=81499 RepID=A0ABP6WZ34_9ACTN